jgi:hypothetical protein
MKNNRKKWGRRRSSAENPSEIWSMTVISEAERLIESFHFYEFSNKLIAYMKRH